MRVWVQSSITLIQEALSLLVEAHGYVAEARRTKKTDIALWDLSGHTLPYPAPSDLPTLALLKANDADIASLLHLRYRGVLKPTDSGESLKRALDAVRRGEIWADRRHLTMAFDHLAKPVLTNRERQTLQLLAKGLSNRAIAESLEIAEGTVKMHVSRLFDKHGVRSRAALLVQIQGH